LNTLSQNLNYTFRILRKNPIFTTVAVLSLALGIGANTAIFTLTNALLLRSLPVRQPERLVEVSLIHLDSKYPFPYRLFQELERGQHAFTGLIGVDLGYQWHVGKMVSVEMDGVLSQNHLLWVTDNFYTELGVAPRLGRLFTPGDAVRAPKVAVVSHEFWERSLGGRAGCCGQTDSSGGACVHSYRGDSKGVHRIDPGGATRNHLADYSRAFDRGRNL